MHTTVNQLDWRGRVAVTRQRSFHAIVVYAALASVHARITTRPKSVTSSVFVVPPGVGDASNLEWCEVAVVLEFIIHT